MPDYIELINGDISLRYSFAPFKRFEVVVRGEVVDSDATNATSLAIRQGLTDTSLHPVTFFAPLPKRSGLEKQNPLQQR